MPASILSSSCSLVFKYATMGSIHDGSCVNSITPYCRWMLGSARYSTEIASNKFACLVKANFGNASAFKFLLCGITSMEAAENERNCYPRPLPFGLGALTLTEWDHFSSSRSQLCSFHRTPRDVLFGLVLLSFCKHITPSLMRSRIIMWLARLARHTTWLFS